MPNRPPSLPSLQRWLRWAFTDPRGPEAALAGTTPAGLNLPLRKEPRPRQAPWVAEAPPAGRARRLEIYADAYFLRLSDNLAEDFPGVRAALDKDAFRRLCADFLSRHPSRSPLAGLVGKPLPAFLTKHPSSEKVPWLADAAALDWAVLDALQSDRSAPLDPAALAAVPADAWGKARLRLDATVRLVDVSWPVERAWQARLEGRRSANLLMQSPGTLLVWRDAEWARVRRADAMEALALRSILQGETLGKALRRVAAAGGADASSWLAAWAGDGVLKSVKL
ncbi:DUF2063 domain-containing protein [bacterium]|nr:MAG: DUF2063 domain-containing protein [bacterium]